MAETPIASKLYFSRSPIVVDINEATQISTRIDIYIWNICGEKPKDPAYTLSKKIVSTTQRKTSYNVANYIREYINPIFPTPNSASVVDPETDIIAVNFEVERYYTVGSTETKLSSVIGIATSGYSYYENGRNYTENLPTFLCDRRIPINAFYGGNKNYVDFITKNAGFSHKLYYGSPTVGEVSMGATFTPTCVPFIFKIPVNIDGFFDTYGVYPTYLKVVYDIFEGNDVYITLPLKYVEECKYQPRNVQFINQMGGWQPLIFYKNSTMSASLKGTDYKLAQNDYNYDVRQGQYQSININGKRTHKLNTGWVDESYKDLIENLMASEVILLDNKPVNCKTQSMEYKTFIKDRMINYTIVFEEAVNLINDMI